MAWAPQRKLLFDQIIDHARRAGQALGHGDHMGYELELGMMDSALDDFVRAFDIEPETLEEIEDVLLTIRIKEFDDILDHLNTKVR